MHIGNLECNDQYEANGNLSTKWTGVDHVLRRKVTMSGYDRACMQTTGIGQSWAQSTTTLYLIQAKSDGIIP